MRRDINSKDFSLVDVNDVLKRDLINIRQRLLSIDWNVSISGGRKYSSNDQDIKLPETAYLMITEIDKALSNNQISMMPTVWSLDNIIKTRGKNSDKSKEYAKCYSGIQDTCDYAVDVILIPIKKEIERKEKSNHANDIAHCNALRDVLNGAADDKKANLTSVDRLTQTLERLHSIKNQKAQRFLDKYVFMRDDIFLSKESVNAQIKLSPFQKREQELKSLVYMKGILDNKNNGFTENFKNAKLLMENEYRIRSPNGRYKVDLERLIEYHKQLPIIIKTIKDLKKNVPPHATDALARLKQLQNDAQFALDTLNINPPQTQSLLGARVTIDSSKMSHRISEDPYRAGKFLAKSYDELDETPDVTATATQQQKITKNVEQIQEQRIELALRIHLNGIIETEKGSFNTNFRNMRVLIDNGYHISLPDGRNEINLEHLGEYHKQLPSIIHELQGLKKAARKVGASEEVKKLKKLQQEAQFALDALNSPTPYQEQSMLGSQVTVRSTEMTRHLYEDPLRAGVILAKSYSDKKTSSLKSKPLAIATTAAQIQERMRILTSEVNMEGIIRNDAFVDNFKGMKMLLENDYRIKLPSNLDEINLEHLKSYRKQLPAIIDELRVLINTAKEVAPIEAPKIRHLLHNAQYALNFLNSHPPKLQSIHGAHVTVAPTNMADYLFKDPSRPGALRVKHYTEVKDAALLTASSSKQTMTITKASQVKEKFHELASRVHLLGIIDNTHNEFFNNFKKMKVLLENDYRVSLPNGLHEMNLEHLIKYHEQLPTLIQTLADLKNIAKEVAPNEVKNIKQLQQEAQAALNVLNTNPPQSQTANGAHAVVACDNMANYLYTDAYDTLKAKLYLEVDARSDAASTLSMQQQQPRKKNAEQVEAELRLLSSLTHMGGIINTKTGVFSDDFRNMRVLLDNAYRIKSPSGNIIDLEGLNKYRHQLPAIINKLQELENNAKEVAPKERENIKRLQQEAQFALDILNAYPPNAKPTHLSGSPQGSGGAQLIVDSKEMANYLYKSPSGVLLAKHYSEVNPSVVSHQSSPRGSSQLHMVKKLAPDKASQKELLSRKNNQKMDNQQAERTTDSKQTNPPPVKQGPLNASENVTVRPSEENAETTPRKSNR